MIPNHTDPENTKQAPKDGRAADRLTQAGKASFFMVMEDQPITDEIRSQLLTELEDWRRDHPKSDGRPYALKETAGRVGVSPSVLSEVLAAKYKGDSDNVIRLIDTFLAEERQRVGHHDFRQFTRVELTAHVFGALDEGIRLGTMPAIIAPPGSGKSVHARAYAQDRASTYVVRIEDEPADKHAVTRLLCDALHDHRGVRELAPMKDRPHPQRLESIKAWLRKRRNTVLIIDEAQKLSRSGLELLRDLHDTCGVAERGLPIAFFGDERFQNLIGDARQGRTRVMTEQFSSRIYPVVRVDTQCTLDGGEQIYSVDDVIAITRNNRFRLLSRQAIKWLTMLANLNRFGHLRRAMTVLRSACRLYADVLAAQKPLEVAHLQEALTITAGRGLAIEIDLAAGGELLRKVAV
jgi:hypothetical protein